MSENEQNKVKVLSNSDVISQRTLNSALKSTSKEFSIPVCASNEKRSNVPSPRTVTTTTSVSPSKK